MASIMEDSIGRGYGGIGFGGGGDGLGVLLGLLLARGGLDGNRRDGGCNDCATTGDLLQQTLGDIKASIPSAEGELQLALAQLQAQLTSGATANTQFLGSQLNTLALNQLIQSNTIQTAVAAVDTNVDRQACETRSTVKDSERNILEAINNNRIRDLEQQLTVSQLRESEARTINREQENSHNVTVQVNQQQAQSQLQFQAINNVLAHLCGSVNQVAKATNSQVVVGSTGVVGGAQTANPNNVSI